MRWRRPGSRSRGRGGDGGRGGRHGTGDRVPSSGPLNGVLFFGTGALDHVDIVAGTDGPGVWLPDYVAEPLDAGPGDQVELRSGKAVVPVTVDGVYRALYAQPSTGYWRTWSGQLYPCPDCPPPPQPILVDRAQLIALATQLGSPRARFAIVAPVRADPPLSLDEAHRLSAFTNHFADQLGSPDSPLSDVFPCCGRLFNGTGQFSTAALLGAMPGVVRIVDQRIAAVQGPIQVLFLAALAISFGVMAAAGVFSFASRRVDAGVLVVRGWGPARVGFKAVLESILPCVSGAVLGFLMATATIAWLGPDGSIEPSARASALIGSIAATLAAIALVGVVSALSFVRQHESRGGASRLVLFLPWELLAFFGAYLMSRRLHSTGGVLGSAVQRPAPAVFLFPLLLAFGVAILSARLLTRRAVPSAPRRHGTRVGVVPGGATTRVVVPARRALPGRRLARLGGVHGLAGDGELDPRNGRSRRRRCSSAATSSFRSVPTPWFPRTSDSPPPSRPGPGRRGRSRTPIGRSTCWRSTRTRSSRRPTGTPPSPIDRSPI